MAILDQSLIDELTNDPLGVGYAGAGARPLLAMLTGENTASSETWITSPTPKNVERNAFISELSETEAAAFLDFIDGATDAGKAMKLQWLYSTNTMDMASAYNTTKISAAGFLSAPTKAALLRLGEVQQSRSQELWSEQVTIEQIRSVL